MADRWVDVPLSVFLSLPLLVGPCIEEVSGLISSVRVVTVLEHLLVKILQWLLDVPECVSWNGLKNFLSLR